LIAQVQNTETPPAPPSGPGGGAPAAEGGKQAAQPARANKPGKSGGSNKRRQQQRREPNEKAFLRRANRMAKAQTQEFQKRYAAALGIEGDFSPEKLEAKIADLERQKQDGQSAAQRQEARLKQLEQEYQRARRETNRLKKEAKREKLARQRLADEKRASETDSELKLSAIRAGFSDPDYALHLVQQHLERHGSENFDPSRFFEGLKGEQRYKHLFQEQEVAAGPTRGAPPVQTPRDPAPAQQTPARPDDGDVERMSRQDFNQRTFDKYGFRPSL